MRQAIITNEAIAAARELSTGAWVRVSNPQSPAYGQEGVLNNPEQGNLTYGYTTVWSVKFNSGIVSPFHWQELELLRRDRLAEVMAEIAEKAKRRQDEPVSLREARVRLRAAEMGVSGNTDLAGAVVALEGRLDALDRRFGRLEEMISHRGF